MIVIARSTATKQSRSETEEIAALPMVARNDRGGNNLFLGVVIDPDVALDETVDAGLVEPVEGVDPRPGREGDPGVHVGIGCNAPVHVPFLSFCSPLVSQVACLNFF